MILLWYYCDILTIILSSSSSSSSSKWLTLKPTFVIWCGRGGRWLLDKLPSLELITRLQSDQDYHLVLMIIMCQFCLFLLVQSHQIYVVDIFLNLTSKVFPLRPAFLTALSRGKTGKRRMRIFISSLAGKSWGYRRNFGNLGAITALKFFWEFLLKNTFFRLVQYGAKVEICGKREILYGAENENNISNGTTDPGVECFD